MELTSLSAMIFAPFVVPLCLFTCWTDLKGMKIYNKTVLLLGAVFVVLGPLALPFDEYLWRLTQIAVVLAIGFVANAAGVFGAGDAKFAAAAAPFIAFGDLRFLLALFTANLLAAYVAHRIAKHTPLRRLAPEWESWDRGRDFPMGLALGGSLALYLLIGVFYGA